CSRMSVARIWVKERANAEYSWTRDSRSEKTSMLSVGARAHQRSTTSSGTRWAKPAGFAGLRRPKCECCVLVRLARRDRPGQVTAVCDTERQDNRPDDQPGERPPGQDGGRSRRNLQSPGKWGYSSGLDRNLANG